MNAMQADTKDFVTPYAFQVAPALLGLPLAKPIRRFWALMIDLLLAAMLGGIGGWEAGSLLVAVYLYSRVIWKRGTPFRERFKHVRIKNLVLLVLLVLTASIFDSDSDEDAVKVKGVVTDSAGTAKEINWDEFGKKMAAIDYTDSAEVAETMESISTAIAPAVADSSRKAQKAEIRRLKKRIDELEEKLENPGLLTTIKNFASQAGLSVGWIGLYFVLFPTWMAGQTPAKRWLKIRVVALNGSELSWWNNLERFGGYTAGLATGLLGFAQIYWDANRQTIHDKVTETVVIDLRKPRSEKYTVATAEEPTATADS